jgi:hypothetical protein
MPAAAPPTAPRRARHRGLSSQHRDEHAELKVRLAITDGDAVLAVAKDHIPNITANASGIVTNVQTAGRKMLKAGNEHFVQLPGVGRTELLSGSYYLVVASEGLVGANTTRIGTGGAGYVLQSIGPMPEVDLGLLDINDIIYTGQLEGGESAAFHFHNYSYPTTLGFESLEDTVGNPVMVIGTLDLADLARPALGRGVPPSIRQYGVRQFAGQ